MKPSFKADYCKLLKGWDKIHHLLGNSKPETLYDESVHALATLPSKDNQVLVDIGAGNGILGIPAFFEGYCQKLVLIEPLVKRYAFLVTWRLSLGREAQNNVLLINSKLESVSRETLEEFAQTNVGNMIFMARAFSGTRTLKEAFDHSKLDINEVYEFFSTKDADKQKFMLRPLKLGGVG